MRYHYSWKRSRPGKVRAAVGKVTKKVVEKVNEGYSIHPPLRPDDMVVHCTAGDNASGNKFFTCS